MPFILILYLILSLSIFFLPGKLKRYKSIIIAFFQLAVFTWLFFQLPAVNKGLIKTYSAEWIPALGLTFEFTLDSLSLLFALLITGIGFLVFLYAHAYMKSYSGTDKFNFYLTLFSGAMLGLVFSSNFIQLFVFWELTSVLSFMLISFFNSQDKSRKAAFQALFITGLGGLCLLAGLILIGSITNSYSLDDWILHADRIKAHPFYLPGLLLILVGAFSKSAQFPFHFWLPGAMQAPTPVSSYLHSATMVKAGIFLLARLIPVLGQTTEWTYIIPVAGAVTMLVGSYLSITQTDLKAVLAYTTISALGVLVLLVGIDTQLSLKAAFVFLLVHAFYKASLFMLTGLIDKKTGTRDLSLLGGLLHKMPVTFIVSLIALLSMAGLPPMLGFIGKELIYEAKVQSPGIASLILILGVTSNILMVAISLYLIRKLFFGRLGPTPKPPNEKGVFLLAGPVLLAVFSLGLGLFPNFLNPVLESILNLIRLATGITIKLKIWHGFNQVFFLSFFTVIMGTLLFWLISSYEGVLQKWREFNRRVFSLNLSEVFDNSIQAFVNFSGKYTRQIQHGYHRYYLMTIILFTTLFLWGQAYYTRGWELETLFNLKPFYIAGLILIIVLATIFSVTSRSRVVTIIAMGVVGYGISLIFMYYSAIDLAITQIIVETLTVVMFMLILQRMPTFARLSRPRTRLRDALIALSFGGVMTVLALKAINVDFNHPISDFYLENSYLKAYGENVVNVILVDFRALDTLGEVTVLSIAAIGVYTLIKTIKQSA